MHNCVWEWWISSQTSLNWKMSLYTLYPASQNILTLLHQFFPPLNQMTGTIDIFLIGSSRSNTYYIRTVKSSNSDSHGLTYWLLYELSDRPSFYSKEDVEPVYFLKIKSNHPLILTFRSIRIINNRNWRRKMKSIEI